MMDYFSARTTLSIKKERGNKSALMLPDKKKLREKTFPK